MKGILSFKFCSDLFSFVSIIHNSLNLSLSLYDSTFSILGLYASCVKESS